MKLNEAQNLFKSLILKTSLDPGSTEELRPMGTLSLEEALEIYRKGYFERLSSALRGTYETVFRVIPEDKIKNLCESYILSNPPTTYQLSKYGLNFPEFLNSCDIVNKIPYLYDLARFEWLYEGLNQAPTPDSLPAESIQEVLVYEDFKIHFCEALEVFQSPYSIFEIWKQRKNETLHTSLPDLKKPETLLVFRKQHKRCVERIGSIEGQILLALLKGETVSEALLHFMPFMPPNKVTDFFQLLMRSGIIEDIVIVPT